MQNKGELKEQFLANTRKKMGISEEKRQDFKQRAQEAKARRQKKAAEMKTRPA